MSHSYSKITVFLVFLLVALVSAKSFAVEKRSKEEIDSIYKKAIEGSYEMSTKDGPVVCYPNVITEEEKKIGFSIPCAPKDFKYVPSVDFEEEVTSDREGIWTEEEIKSNPDKPSISRNIVYVGDKRIIISQMIGGFCTPRSCPTKILVETGGKRKIKDIGLACASNQSYFIDKETERANLCGRIYNLK